MKQTKPLRFSLFLFAGFASMILTQGLLEGSSRSPRPAFVPPVYGDGPDLRTELRRLRRAVLQQKAASDTPAPAQTSHYDAKR